MSYGRKIAELRKRSGMTQADLGKELNVTFQAVSKWERDESRPDFETMSKMAKIFGVGLTYFENDSDETPATSSAPQTTDTPQSAVPQAPAPQAPAPQPAAPQAQIVGFCKECGKVLREGEAIEGEGGYLYCKACSDKLRRQKESAAAEEKRRREAYAGELVHTKKKSFIVGTIVAVLLAAIYIVSTICAKLSVWAIIGGGAATLLFTFLVVTQLFWDGAVASAALCLVKVIGTPGIIFTFDWDGFKFLIAMKILFALLRFTVLVLSFICSLLVAAVISPFTFFPALARINGDIDARLAGKRTY